MHGPGRDSRMDPIGGCGQLRAPGGRAAEWASCRVGGSRPSPGPPVSMRAVLLCGDGGRQPALAPAPTVATSVRDSPEGSSVQTTSAPSRALSRASEGSFTTPTDTSQPSGMLGRTEPSPEPGVRDPTCRSPEATRPASSAVCPPPRPPRRGRACTWPRAQGVVLLSTVVPTERPLGPMSAGRTQRPRAAETRPLTARGTRASGTTDAPWIRTSPIVTKSDPESSVSVSAPTAACGGRTDPGSRGRHRRGRPFATRPSGSGAVSRRSAPGRRRAPSSPARGRTPRS